MFSSISPTKKTGVYLLYCFVLSPLISLGAVPHHHLALSVKELTYPELSEACRPARGLPVRRAQAVQDQEQSGVRAQQPDHGRDGGAVQQRGAEGDRELCRLAGQR